MPGCWFDGYEFAWVRVGATYLFNVNTRHENEIRS